MIFSSRSTAVHLKIMHALEQDAAAVGSLRSRLVKGHGIAYSEGLAALGRECLDIRWASAVDVTSQVASPHQPYRLVVTDLGWRSHGRIFKVR